jgi:acyl-coenzyme A thioesterase PaaI-like protein
MRVKLPLSWRTRNYVGTIFGGSMYGAIDPMFMFMLIKILGPDYIVWDKAATIRFRRPGRGTLTATLALSPEVVRDIKTAADQTGKTEKDFVVDLVNASGEVHASFTKLVSIRRRDASPPASKPPG